MSISLDQQSKFYTVFLWRQDFQNLLKLADDHLVLPHMKLVSLPIFLYDFSRKMFLKLYSINWPNFIVWLPLLLQILGNMFIVNIIYQLMTSLMAFLSSHFPTWPKMLGQKNVNILTTKRAFSIKWKALFIIFKGSSSRQTKPNPKGRQEFNINSDTKCLKDSIHHQSLQQHLKRK